MSASSGDIARLEGVTTKQICALLTVLRSASLPRAQLIERSYSEVAANFTATVGVLLDIHWAEASADSLLLSTEGTAACDQVHDEDAIRRSILDTLTSDSSPYASAIAAYLRHFEPCGGVLVHKPSLAERTDERPIRDLFIDLRMVSYRPETDSYVLEEPASPVYVWAKNRSTPKTKGEFEALQKRREELAYAAELQVVQYEKERVGDPYAGRVKHVSQLQPFASYDILSVTVTGKAVVDRYIEVKVVSAETLQFYWSRSEVDVATLMRDQYYLYLVPYTMAGGFDLPSVTVIRDPVKAILENSDTWETEQDVLICRRRPPSASAAG